LLPNGVLVVRPHRTAAHVSSFLSSSAGPDSPPFRRAHELMREWDCRTSIMPLQRVSYRFTIRLPVGRRDAYRWATDYREDDFKIMGFRGGRKVERLANGLILLTDSFDADPFERNAGRRTTKVKLVHLFPERWAWTATHVAGPARFSQFLYQLRPSGSRSCVLEFRGNQVERVRLTPTAATLRRRAQELRREDSRLWHRLSRGLAKSLRG